MGDKSPKSTAKANKQKAGQKAQAKASTASAAAPKK